MCERPVGRWRAVGATGSWMPVPGSLDPLLPPRSCAAVSAEAARGHRAGALGAGLATRRGWRRRQGSRAPAIRGGLGAVSTKQFVFLRDLMNGYALVRARSGFLACSGRPPSPAPFWFRFRLHVQNARLGSAPAADPGNVLASVHRLKGQDVPSGGILAGEQPGRSRGAAVSRSGRST